MSDFYIYEAIDVIPPISEGELEAGFATGRYTKVTWGDDRRIGDGYFARVGTGMIGLAMYPRLDDSRGLIHEVVTIEVNPVDDDHRDTGLDEELRQILEDFGTTPDGSARRFERGIHIDCGEEVFELVVSDGRPLRKSAR